MIEHYQGSEAVSARPPLATPEARTTNIADAEQLPLHPLIRSTQKLVRGHKPTSDGILCTARLGGLDVDVSPALWGRALVLLNRLCIQISARGWTVVLRDGRTEVAIGQQNIREPSVEVRDFYCA